MVLKGIDKGYLSKKDLITGNVVDVELKTTTCFSFYPYLSLLFHTSHLLLGDSSLAAFDSWHHLLLKKRVIFAPACPAPHLTAARATRLTTCFTSFSPEVSRLSERKTGEAPAIHGS